VPVKYSSMTFVVEADRLEDLCAGVGGDRRDAHFDMTFKSLREAFT